MILLLKKNYLCLLAPKTNNILLLNSHMRESQFQNTYMNMEYGIFGILSFGNQESVPSWGISNQWVKGWKLETGITVNSGWHMLNDTSLLVFSVVPSSVIQQVCIHYIIALNCNNYYGPQCPQFPQLASRLSSFPSNSTMQLI